MRILQVDNWQWRRYGDIRVSTSRKLFNGLIRGNHQVLEFSDRDIASYEAPLRIRRLGVGRANRLLIETAQRYKPDMLLIGHADLITNETLVAIKAKNPALRIAYRNVDPLFNPRTVRNIMRRVEVADAIFITTGGEQLKQFLRRGNRVCFMPNPTDSAVECFDNAGRTEFDRDLLFCGIGSPDDPRHDLVGRLREELDGVRFDIFGMHGKEPLWGAAYDLALAGSKMGLNLNRQEGDYLYSSARISQLMGNGILTFMARASGYDRFFGDDELAVFFDGASDLVEKVLRFHKDDARRQQVAARGQAWYRQEFSGQRVAAFMIDVAFERDFAHDYPWQDQVFTA